MMTQKQTLVFDYGVSSAENRFLEAIRKKTRFSTLAVPHWLISDNQDDERKVIMAKDVVDDEEGQYRTSFNAMVNHSQEGVISVIEAVSNHGQYEEPFFSDAIFSMSAENVALIAQKLQFILKQVHGFATIDDYQAMKELIVAQNIPVVFYDLMVEFEIVEEPSSPAFDVIDVSYVTDTQVQIFYHNPGFEEAVILTMRVISDRTGNDSLVELYLPLADLWDSFNNLT